MRRSVNSQSGAGGMPFDSRVVAKGVLSIDKISFIVNIKNNFYSVLNRYFSVDAEDNYYQFQDPLFQYNFNVNGGELIMQFGTSVCDSKGRKIRIEFNPNKFDFKKKSYQNLFNSMIKLEMADVTRLDLAIDLFSILNPLNFMDKYKMKNFICHGRGGPETVYLGSPSSNNRIKIYNKKKEREEKGDKVEHDNWWRVESVQRDLKIFLDSDFSKIKNPFRNLFYVSEYEANTKSDFIKLFVSYANRYGYQAALRLINADNHSKQLKNDLILSANIDCSTIFNEQISSVWYCFKNNIGVVGKRYSGI